MQKGRRGWLWLQVPDSELCGQLTHLGQFPLLILGHVAILAREVAAPEAQGTSTGM